MKMSDLRSIALALAGLGAIGAAAVAGVAETRASDSGVNCEIVAENSNGRVALKPVVYGYSGATGSYSFHVASAGAGGSTNIRQGGNFVLPASGAAALGQVALGGNATYDVVLTVDVGGEQLICEERVGGNSI